MPLETPEQIVKAAALMREWAKAELIGDPIKIEKQQWWRLKSDPWFDEWEPLWDWSTWNYRKKTSKSTNH